MVAGHVIKNALPKILAVMGLQFGYLLGGSIWLKPFSPGLARASCSTRPS